MSGITWLRVLALLEGISLLLLLFVAMPLKYFAGLPLAVRIAGSLHGLLFVMFAATLFRVAMERRWRLSKGLMVLGASVIPFGAFFLDRVLRRPEI